MIACPHGGEVYTIATTRDALKLLATAWPVAEGKAYVAAIDTCEAVITGAATPENARLAFLAAADDAKVAYEFIAMATPSEPIKVIRSEGEVCWGPRPGLSVMIFAIASVVVVYY